MRFWPATLSAGLRRYYDFFVQLDSWFVCKYHGFLRHVKHCDILVCACQASFGVVGVQFLCRCLRCHLDMRRTTVASFEFFRDGRQRDVGSGHFLDCSCSCDWAVVYFFVLWMVTFIFDDLVSNGVEDFALRYSKFLSARKVTVFLFANRVFLCLES